MAQLTVVLPKSNDRPVQGFRIEGSKFVKFVGPGGSKRSCTSLSAPHSSGGWRGTLLCAAPAFFCIDGLKGAAISRSNDLFDARCSRPTARHGRLEYWGFALHIATDSIGHSLREDACPASDSGQRLRLEARNQLPLNSTPATG